MKIALYVEGQTELIFVREFLLKWYEHNASILGFKCYELRSGNLNNTPFSYGNRDSERYYIIVNAGGDTAALSKALNNAENHRNQGFDRVLVLRDMYSERYRSESTVIDSTINDRFIARAKRDINENGFRGFVHCHFAIMEIEAWFLGMGWYLEKIHPSLTEDKLLNELHFDLDTDPEITIYHPAQRLADIYSHVNEVYDKHRHDVNSIMSHLNKTDFEMLLEFDKCISFNSFVYNLIN